MEKLLVQLPTELTLFSLHSLVRTGTRLTPYHSFHSFLRLVGLVLISVTLCLLHHPINFGFPLRMLLALPFSSWVPWVPVPGCFVHGFLGSGPWLFYFLFIICQLIDLRAALSFSRSMSTRSSMQILVSCGTSGGITTLCSVGVGADQCLSFLSCFATSPLSRRSVHRIFQWISPFSVFLFAPSRTIAVASFSVVDLQSTYWFF